MTLYPLLISPRFDERIWGGHKLADLLGKDAPRDKPIGEAWEIYEENTVANGAYAGRTVGQLRQELGVELMGHVPADQLFPLLTKLIDAQDVLSVQVHPDDAEAHELEHQPYGKTECWYIIDAAPGAELIYGFSRDSSPEEYKELVAEGTLEQILRPLPVKAGDVVYLPARTVHAIGAGILLFELQQTSDVTYRIYDWNRRDAQGRPRELHVEKAARVLDYHRFDRGPIRTLSLPDYPRAMLVAGPYFSLELVEVQSGPEIDTYRSPVGICTLDRPVRVTAAGQSVELKPYSSALIPAAAGSYRLEGFDGVARVLVAYVPESQEATRQDLLRRGFSRHEIDGFLEQFAPVGGSPTRG